MTDEALDDRTDDETDDSSADSPAFEPPDDETSSDETSDGPAFDSDASGNDNIREGRVGGLMGAPHATQGQGQGG